MYTLTFASENVSYQQKYADRTQDVSEARRLYRRYPDTMSWPQVNVTCKGQLVAQGVWVSCDSWLMRGAKPRFFEV